MIQLEMGVTAGAIGLG